MASDPSQAERLGYRGLHFKGLGEVWDSMNDFEMWLATGLSGYGLRCIMKVKLICVLRQMIEQREGSGNAAS